MSMVTFRESEVQEEEEEEDDQFQIVIKGKRTKRQRLQSQIDQIQIIPSTEEEVLMANCLILLAQGSPRKDNPFIPPPRRGDSATVVLNKSVYECKTCNRVFSSFQALGGHRTSHRKLKTDSPDDESGERFKSINDPPLPPPLSLQWRTNNKLHECSVCGVEFLSGQALGGHMRRHRGTPGVASTSLSLSSSMAPKSTEQPRSGCGKDGWLSLDLNLPANPENEMNRNGEAITGLALKQDNSEEEEEKHTQTHLSISNTTPLVDCHY